MTRAPRLYLQDIAEAIHAIENYTHGMTEAEFRANRLVQDSVVRRLEIIGEATRQLPAATKSTYSAVPWRQIAGLRNRITHELGHIVRLHRVPEAERLAAVVSREFRVQAARQLAADGEFIPLLAQGMSPEAIGDFMSDWHEALAIQVANGPVDLRIEQWIHGVFLVFAGSKNDRSPKRFTAAMSPSTRWRGSSFPRASTGRLSARREINKVLINNSGDTCL